MSLECLISPFLCIQNRPGVDNKTEDLKNSIVDQFMQGVGKLSKSLVILPDRITVTEIPNKKIFSDRGFILDFLAPSLNWIVPIVTMNPFKIGRTLYKAAEASQKAKVHEMSKMIDITKPFFGPIIGTMMTIDQFKAQLREKSALDIILESVLMVNTYLL